MKNIICVFALLFLVLACKTENKNTRENEIIQDIVVKKKTLTFEDQLLDLRDIDEEFVENYKVDKFGMQKVNDSIFAFVFKLNKNTTPKTVEDYSIGIRGFDSNNPKTYQSSFSPKIEVIEGDKYIVLRKNMENIRFFDSIDVYIYERQNWKKSGRMGSMKIRDVLFEN